MSTPQAAEERGWEWLPPRLRPRSAELPGTGQLRLVETTLLILVGVFLAVATINDVARQSAVNERLSADVATWRHYTGHSYHNLSVDQQLFGSASEREVVCGNTSPGPPKERTQLCLLIWGPLIDGRRAIHGGWYVPARLPDTRAARYGCFGAGARGLCPR